MLLGVLAMRVMTNIRFFILFIYFRRLDQIQTSETTHLTTTTKKTRSRQQCKQIASIVAANVHFEVGLDKMEGREYQFNA